VVELAVASQTQWRLLDEAASITQRTGVLDGRASATGMRQSSLQGWIHGVPRIEHGAAQPPDKCPCPKLERHAVETRPGRP